MAPVDAGPHRVPPGYFVHGHAIVSRDDRFADANGRTPPSLRNPADWRRFQAALDGAAVAVLGRLGHELHPNAAPDRRRRIVASAGVDGLEKRAEAWWWNPARCPLEAVLREAAPGGGTVAVPGGQRVFDLFLAIGYDQFDLARAERVTLGEGRALFSILGPDLSADDALRDAGLSPHGPEMLDPQAHVTLTIWRPGGTGRITPR